MRILRMVRDDFSEPPAGPVTLTREQLAQYLDELIACQPDDFQEFRNALLEKIFAEKK